MRGLLLLSFVFVGLAARAFSYAPKADLHPWKARQSTFVVPEDPTGNCDTICSDTLNQALTDCNDNDDYYGCICTSEIDGYVASCLECTVADSYMSVDDAQDSADDYFNECSDQPTPVTSISITPTSTSTDTTEPNSADTPEPTGTDATSESAVPPTDTGSASESSPTSSTLTSIPPAQPTTPTTGAPSTFAPVSPTGTESPNAGNVIRPIGGMWPSILAILTPFLALL